MKKIIALVLTVALAGCQVHEQQEPAPPVERAPKGTLESGSGVETYSSAATASGATVADNLTSRYNDTRQNCGKASMPAVLCTGVELRATVHSDKYFAWNPSPHSQTSGGVPFSYLRKDAKYSRVVYNYKNGIIFYPVFHAPAGKRQIEVLCSFPLDAGTHYRDQQGCGAHSHQPQASKRCQTMGINTAEQWMEHMKNGRPGSYQCGFDVRDSMNNLSADSFYQSLRARNLGGIANFNVHNELILATWPQNIAKELPIEAFFYQEGGLSDAQADQRDFFEQSDGLFVPVIKLTLPSTPTEEARFTFNAADQVKP